MHDSLIFELHLDNEFGEVVSRFENFEIKIEEQKTKRKRKINCYGIIFATAFPTTQHRL